MPLIDEIYEMYRSVALGSSQACNACKPEWPLHNLDRIGPVPIYHVGKEFNNGILFVGSVGVGWENVGRDLDYSNASPTQLDGIKTIINESNDYLFFDDHMGRGIYSFVHTFCEAYFKDAAKGFDRIAISNLLRCNHGGTEGKYPASILAQCANVKNLFFPTFREIGILKPKVIIDMSMLKHRYLLESYDYSQFTPRPLLLQTPYHPSKPGVTSAAHHEWCEPLINKINADNIIV